MTYEAPMIVTLALGEVENASMNAFLDSGGGCGGWFESCCCQCQCQCQCQHQ